jgi:hypothetical protein
LAPLALAFALVATGCRGSTPLAPTPPDPRPARRASGPRVPPPFRGADSAAAGLVRLEGGLWVRAEEVPHWSDGGAHVLPVPGAPPGEGLALRTDHVLVETDLAARHALPIARAAQAHVEALMRAYGDALDLRLPFDPFPVTVFARRSDFEVSLASAIPEPTGWTAFYDGRTGVVRVCAEPAPRAALPLLADLRHELTHAVLDLSAAATPPHAAIVAGRHFWLWEAIAVHAEALPSAGSEPSGAESVRIRRERFRASAAARGRTPLAEFFGLDQERFEGRHYDQASVVTSFLASDPELWTRTLDLLRRLLRGDVLRNDPDRELGVSADVLERRWRDWLAANGLG